MKTLLLSFVCGVLVGVFYGLLKVQAPAPPFIPMVGLFGILIGQQVPPILKAFWVDHMPAICGSKTTITENAPLK